MSVNDICLNIITRSNVDEIKDLNNTLSVIHAWQPPLVFDIVNTTKFCGPLVKIVEQVSKRLSLK